MYSILVIDDVLCTYLQRRSEERYNAFQRKRFCMTLNEDVFDHYAI